MTQTYELFERYLNAVRRYLPWKGQDDILAELRANLESQLEDRESQIGHGLSNHEMNEWLRSLGSPIKMAATYQPQRFLIGPGLFPVFWYVLRVGLFAATLIYALVNVILISLTVQGAPTVAEAITRYPGVLMTVAAWITLSFGAFEFAGTHFPEAFRTGGCWNPASLPPIKSSDKSKGTKSYAQAVSEIIFCYLGLIWLILVPHHLYLLMGPGAYAVAASPYKAAPVWWQFYWMTLALNVIQVAWNGWRLWQGTWREPAHIQRAVYKFIGLVPIVVLLTVPGHLLVLLKHPEIDAVRYAATLNTVNVAAHRGIQVMGAIIIVQLIVESAQALAKEYRAKIARP